MDKETMTTNFGLSRTLRRTASQPPRAVRVVMLGQAAVGKTETIYSHGMSVGGDLVHFEILDTAGQEEDALLIEEKIRWGDAFIIIYSITDRCSFDEVMRLCFLVNHTHSGGARRGAPDPRPPPMVIVANKKDLVLERMVAAEEGEGLSRGLKLPFWEISARDGWEEPAAVFHTLYSHVVQQVDSAPASFRHRGVSKLMERIPRISSGAPSGPPGTPSRHLGPNPPGPPLRHLGPPGHAPRSFSLSSFLPD